MAAQKVMTLATVDGQGPHAVNLYFACDDRLNMYFVSHPSSTHCRHVEKCQAVAATVFATAEMWQKVRGVQIRGQCALVPESRRNFVQALLFEKFPGMTEIERHVRTCACYCITPTWMRWIDNSVRFGHKVELCWPWPPTVTFRGYDGQFV